MTQAHPTYNQLYQALQIAQREADSLKLENRSLIAENDSYKYVIYFYRFQILLFCRNAYAVLANAVPQLLTISNPLCLPIPPSSSIAASSLTTPTLRDPTWPKSTDFTPEQLATLFWSKQSWNTHNKGSENLHPDVVKGKRGRTRAADGINVKMRYVVHSNGEPVDGHRASVIRGVARTIWSQLSDNNKAPQTWMSNATLAVMDHYRHEMATRCPELRYCENGWKADQIAIDYYSAWRKGKDGKGRFNPLVKKEIQEDDSDDEDEDSPSEVDVRLPQKRKLASNELPVPKKQKGSVLAAKKLSDVSVPPTNARPTPKMVVKNPLMAVSSMTAPPIPSTSTEANVPPTNDLATNDLATSVPETNDLATSVPETNDLATNVTETSVPIANVSTVNAPALATSVPVTNTLAAAIQTGPGTSAGTPTLSNMTTAVISATDISATSNSTTDTSIASIPATDNSATGAASIDIPTTSGPAKAKKKRTAAADMPIQPGNRPTAMYVFHYAIV